MHKFRRVMSLALASAMIAGSLPSSSYASGGKGFAEPQTALLEVGAENSKSKAGAEAKAAEDSETKAAKEAEVKAAKETEAKETEAKETKAKETEAKETEAKETEAKETEAKETEAKETEAKETEAKETKAKETETKETEAKETEAKETEAKETKADKTQEAEEDTSAEAKTEEETESAEETESTEETTEEAETEFACVNIVVSYEDAVPTDDFEYLLTWADQKDAEKKYTGICYIYDEDGKALTLGKDAEADPAEYDSEDADGTKLPKAMKIEKGKLVIPLDAKVQSGLLANKDYRLNKSDKKIKGYTIVLADVKDGMSYTVAEENGGGLALREEEDGSNQEEQTVRAQKDSENKKSAAAKDNNTARFVYEEIELGESDIMLLDETTAADDAAAGDETTAADDEAEVDETTAADDAAEGDETTSADDADEEDIPEDMPALIDVDEEDIPEDEPAVIADRANPSFTVTYTGAEKAQVKVSFKLTSPAAEGADTREDYTGDCVISGGTGDTVFERIVTAQDGVVTVEFPAAAAADAAYWTGSCRVTLKDAEEGKTYSAALQNPAEGLLSMSKSEQEITANDDADAYDLRNEKTGLTLTKKWNDGNEPHDDAFMEHFLAEHVTVTVDGGETGATAGYEKSADAAAPNVYKYIVKGLPEYSAEGEACSYSFGETEACSGDAAETCPLTAGKYISAVSRSEDGTETAIVNTKKINVEEEKDYSANVIWKDKETGDPIPASRPTDDTTDPIEDKAFANGITIKRYPQGSTSSEEVAVGAAAAKYLEISGSEASNWTISLKDLPKYDDKGKEYTYYIEQNDTEERYAFAGAEEDGTSRYYYHAEYNNTGAYGVKTTGLYNGGTLTDTRRETGGFTFNVKWEDGESTWLRNSKLYLYRFADGDSTGFDTASPVQGYDQMYFEGGVLYYEKGGAAVPVPGKVNADGSMEYTWFGNDGKLEEYAPSGAKYTYYIVQKKLGEGGSDATSTSDYTARYEDNNNNNAASSAEAGVACIVAGGTIINTRNTTVSPSIEKRWEAKAIQGIMSQLTLTLNLEKRYVYQEQAKNADGSLIYEDGKPKLITSYSDWEPAKDGDEQITLTTNAGDFSSAVMTKDLAFEGQPGYTTSSIENVSVSPANRGNGGEVTEPDAGEGEEPGAGAERPAAQNVELSVGTKIEYRCVETAIHYNGNDYSFVENGTTKDTVKMAAVMPDGTDLLVKQIYSEDHQTVTNQLIDQTQVTVKKNWSGLGEGGWPADDEHAVVTVHILREDGVEVKEDIYGNPVSDLTMTKADAANGITFTNLPRYDDNGREIVYYVEEKDKTLIVDGQKYSYFDTNYAKGNADINRNTGEAFDAANDKADDKLTIRATNAVISNTTPPEGNLVINVNKRWLDDGDLTHRKDTKIGVFLKTDIASGAAFENGELLESAARASVTLNDAMAWTGKISVTAQMLYLNLTGVDAADPGAAQTTNREDGSASDYAVYDADAANKVKTDDEGNVYYWKAANVLGTTNEVTAYPAYVKKTDTSYTGTRAVQAQDFDGNSLWWTDNTHTATTKENMGDDLKVIIYTEGAAEAGAAARFVQARNSLKSSDYIALEMTVGDTPVVYQTHGEGEAASYAWMTADSSQVNANAFENGTEAAGKMGEVATGDHLYNVYLGYTNANGMNGYVIYNQRQGVQEIDISKTWNNGSLPYDQQPKAAYFQIRQWRDSTDLGVVDVTTAYPAKWTKAASFDHEQVEATSCALASITADGSTFENVIKIYNEEAVEGRVAAMQAFVQNLPKYDHMGRLLHYTIEEVAVEDPDTTRGIHRVENGSVKVSVWDGKSFQYEPNTDAGAALAYYDQYSCSVPDPAVETGANNNTGDVFTYTANNTRAQTFSVSLRKVWRDDGSNNVQQAVTVFRPDIYFRMYKIPVGTEAAGTTINKESDLLALDEDGVKAVLGAAEQVGGDYTWNTKHNDWYWTCDTDGQFDRYNEIGVEYLYFALEYSNNFAGYSVSYYNGETLPTAGTSVTNTKQVLNPDDTDHITNNLLIVHKEGDGLQSNGTVLNTRKDTFDATGRKVWANLPSGFDTSKLPKLQMELSRKILLAANDSEYNPWELVESIAGSAGQTIYGFARTDKYDEFGRKYEFDVAEKYYVSYSSLDAVGKTDLNANTKVFRKDGDNYTLIGEGCTLADDGRCTTTGVAYTQADAGEFVKTAENEYVPFESLTSAEQNSVQTSQRFTRTVSGSRELGANDILLLDHVPGYTSQEQSADNKFTWTNTYDPNANKRQRIEVKVNKTWSFPDYTAKLPEQKFELWRKLEGDDAGTSAELVSTAIRKFEVEDGRSDNLKNITEGTGADREVVGEAIVTSTNPDAAVKTVRFDTSIVFKTAGDNSEDLVDAANNQYLPYFSPAGTKYVYYIKEPIPHGYQAQLGTGTAVQAGTKSDPLVSGAITLDKVRTEDGIIVARNFEERTAEGKTTIIDGDVPAYTNTYTGLPVVQNSFEKVWDDQSDAFGMRPADIDLTLTQNSGGLTVNPDGTNGRKAAEWQAGDGADLQKNGEWKKEKDTSDPTAPQELDHWTFSFTNDQIRDQDFLKDQESIKGNSSNFPKYGPDGEEYTYTVTESKAAADGTNSFGNYTSTSSTATIRQNGSDIEVKKTTITNSLPKTSITAKKVWKGTDGGSPAQTWTYTGLAASETAPHDDDELQRLIDLGAFPVSITFTLQYSDDGKANTAADKNWTTVSKTVFDDDGNAVVESGTIKKANVSYTYDLTGDDGKVSLDKVKAIRDTGYTFTDLPMYAQGNNGSRDHAELRQYRIVESSGTGTDASTKAGMFAITKGNSDEEITAANKTCKVENTITLQKKVLKKVWEDRENLMNTRPESLIFDMKIGDGTDDPSTKYTISKTDKEGLDALDHESDTYIDTWALAVWIPTGSKKIYVSETVSNQSDAAEERLQNFYQDPKNINGTIKDETTGEKNKVEDWTTLSAENGSNADQYTITNKLQENLTMRTAIQAQKIWDDAGLEGFYAVIRPESIEYTLEYRYLNAAKTYSDWKAADEKCNVVATEDNPKPATIVVTPSEADRLKTDSYTKTDGTAEDAPLIWSAAWDDLFLYYDAKTSDVPQPISYRVIETIKEGYGNPAAIKHIAGYLDPVYSYGDDYKDGTNEGISAVQSIGRTVAYNVTNTIDKTYLEFTKKWEDDQQSNYTKAMRPASITCLLEYSADEGATWSKVPATALALPAAASAEARDGEVTLTVDETKTSETYLIGASKETKNGAVTIKPYLPKTAANGKQILYRMSELSLNYSGTEKAEESLVKEKVIETVTGDGGTTSETEVERVTWTLTGSKSDFAAETAVGDASPVNSIGAYTITQGETDWDAANGKWTSAITNKLETVTMKVAKVWEDEGGRDNLAKDVTFGLNVVSEPDITVDPNNKNDPNVFTITETATIAKNANPSEAEFKTKVGANEVTLQLPRYKRLAADHTQKASLYKYEAEEKTTLTDYRTTYAHPAFTITDTATAYTDTVTNTHDIYTCSIQPKKIWDDNATGKTEYKGADDAGYTRPASVTMYLQYSTGSAWLPVKHVPTVTDTFPARQYGKYEVIFFHNTKATSNTAAGGEGEETGGSGDASGGGAATVDEGAGDGADTGGTAGGDAAAVTVDLHASGYYKWDTTAQAYLPDNTGIYTTTGTPPTEGDPISYITLSGDAAANTWTTTVSWENLPVYAANQNKDGNRTPITYRVVEAETGDVKYLFARTENITAEKDAEKTASVTNVFKQLTLIKKGIPKGATSEQLLSGVEFKLVRIKDAADTVVTGAPEVIGTTDTNGQVIFYGLEDGTYQVTEWKTNQGYEMLCSPFEVTIPLTMTNKEAKDRGVDYALGHQTDDQQNWEFGQLTYTVTDSASLLLPATGKQGMWYPGFLGALLLPAAWYLLFRKRKRQIEGHTKDN